MGEYIVVVLEFEIHRFYSIGFHVVNVSEPALSMFFPEGSIAPFHPPSSAENTGKVLLGFLTRRLARNLVGRRGCLKHHNVRQNKIIARDHNNEHFLAGYLSLSRTNIVYAICVRVLNELTFKRLAAVGTKWILSLVFLCFLPLF